MKCISRQSLLFIMAAFFISACGKSENTSQATVVAPVAAVAPASSTATNTALGAMGEDGMPVLARKSNCTSCHAIATKKIGPAWMDVARKYKGASTYNFAGKDYPLEAGLIMKVSKGGAGVWGNMPMPPNATVVNDEDIRVLVKFILGLAK
jgi:cytochrome c